MITEGFVGPQASLSEGVQARLSLGKNGEALVSEFRGRYQAAASRGTLYSLLSGSVAIAAANVSPLGANTGQPILGVYNPLGSNRSLAILKVGLVTLSGTPGGPILWNYAINQAITATPNLTPQNQALQGGAASLAKGFGNTALTGSTISTALRHAANVSAVAAGFVNAPVLEDLGGDIIVPPGCFLGLAAFAAGTSHVVQASIVWDEVALVV